MRGASPNPVQRAAGPPGRPEGPPRGVARALATLLMASWASAIVSQGAPAGATSIEGLSQVRARVAESIRLPTDGVRGLAVSGRTLWLLATRNRGLAAPDSSYASALLSLDLESGQVDTLAIEHDSYESGLAWDGTWLWGGGSLLRDHAGIYRIDPVSGGVSVTLPSPGYHPGGLAMGSGYLWQVDCDTRKLYRLETVDGRISRKLATPGFYPTGLAHDGSRFWCADAATGRLYRLRGFNADPEAVVARDAFDRPGQFVSLAWEAGSLWVASASDSTAVRIELAR